MSNTDNASPCVRWELCRKPRPEGKCPFSRRDFYEDQPPSSHLKWHPLDDSLGEEEGCDEYNSVDKIEAHSNFDVTLSLHY